MVRNNTERRIGAQFLVRGGGNPICQLVGSLEQWLEQVSLIVTDKFLKDACDPLQPHPRID